MGILSHAAQSQTVKCIALECGREQKHLVFLFFLNKGLVKQWSDASNNSGRF